MFTHFTTPPAYATEPGTPSQSQDLRGQVVLHRVTKVFFGGTCVLEDVSLRITQGEFIFITGVSGAGKSTLLRLLYGAEEATQGRVIVDNTELTRIRPRPLALLRRRLGVVFQDYRLLSNRTVHENVAFVLRAQGMSPAEIRRRLEPTLKMVGLAQKGHRFPHELSGGEQQRLSLARAIVNTPSILLADEPTGNLDQENSLLVLEILKRLNSFGVTILMTTHDPYLLSQAHAAGTLHVRHRLLRLHNGHLFDVQSPEP